MKADEMQHTMETETEFRPGQPQRRRLLPSPHGPPQMQFHSRSCTECSRRKVRCDHRHPCANCMRAQSECIFPKTRRTPVRRTNKGRDQVLLQSLQRLESRLPPSDGSVPGDCKKEEPPRLVLDHDRSRYISNAFWAGMAKDVEEMRDVLDGSSPEPEEETPSPHHSFIFSPGANPPHLPSASDLLTLFDVFQENVDPVVRIFHRPTLRTTILEALPLLAEGQPVDRHSEVIIFSICFAAVTSLNSLDCESLLHEEHGILLQRYRQAVEHSLARARFLESQNQKVLASLVLFLLCVRRHDNSRFVSSLLGVVIRNAQAMGLHRDGTNFQLSPYETEMRRRLWWHICVLDIRASEDHGCDPSIYHQHYDTKFPLDINDEDISPDDNLPPEQRTSGSDMTFCLLRFEVSVAIRKLNYPAPGSTQQPQISKGSIVETIEKHFYERYIDRCDITKPYDWVAATWARLMLAKMWLSASTPLQGDLAFQKSVEVLELSDVLETGHRAARWRWLFLTHVQWHAVAFVLAYLCARPTDELSHRAWTVVDRVSERWLNDMSQRGMLWKPIRRLMERAKQVRQDEDAMSQTLEIAPVGETAQIHDSGDPIHTQMPGADWTGILLELQMGFQNDHNVPPDAVEAYGWNLWDGL